MFTTPCHALLVENPCLRFGDWLVRRGLINRVDLFDALSTVYGDEQLRLGDALVRSGVLPRAVVETEATQHRSFLARAAQAQAQTVQFPLGEHS